MDKMEIGLVAGLTASLAGGAQAETLEWGHYLNQPLAQINPETNSSNRELAQQITETGEITKTQVSQIQTELSSNFSFDIKGAEDYIQGNASFIHNNLGLGLQSTHTDNVDQLALTAGVELTPSETSALARVVDNGQIKISLVESEVKNAVADFDETALGVEFVVNLKNAFLKQISLSHSQHDLDITDGSNAWRITDTNSNTVIDTQQTASQTIQTTSTTIDANEARNVTQDVNQTAVQVLLGLTKDMDAVLGYAKDNLGKSLSSAEIGYRLNANWSLNAGYEQTRRFSGDEKHNIKTATLNYNKNNWSAFAGLRDNGIDTSPYAGLQYRYEFSKPKNTSTRTHLHNNSRNIGSILTSPAQGTTELHPHAIQQETRTTTTLETNRSIDNIANGSLSNISTTTDSCSADFNVTDKDGVTGVIVRLSNGEEQQLSGNSGNVTFTGLSDDTSYTMDLFGISKNGLNNTAETNRLGSAQCTTKKEPVAVADPEPAKSNPILNPIGTVNVNDNGGGLPTTIPAPTGSDIQAGAKYSLIGAPAGLTIDEDTGKMTFNQDINGNQTGNVTVQVINSDGQSSTTTFILNVTDNG